MHASTYKCCADILNKYSGAMLDSHPEQAKEVPFRRNMIIYTGETIEEIRGLIKEDIYAKSGVWDVDNAQIILVRLIIIFFSPSLSYL